MRRLSVLVLALALLGAVAAEAHPKPKQVERGEVVAPTGVTYAGPVRLGACATADAATSWAARHGLAYRFDVNPSSWRRPFALTAARPADLDIVFALQGGGSEAFATTGIAQERGTVPKHARSAYVCLAAGPSTPFTYVAG